MDEITIGSYWPRNFKTACRALLRIRNEPFYIHPFIPPTFGYATMDKPRGEFGFEAMFETLRTEVPWVNKGNAPRDECFMALDLARKYSYGSAARDRTYTAERMHPLTRGIMLELECWFDTKFNAVVLNYYKDQHQHLGWHADDSPEQDLAHPIAVVSFGAERQIWVRGAGEKGEVPDDQKYTLANGSLFMMPGGYQSGHYHKIPKHDRECGGRISLTFRKLDR